MFFDACDGIFLNYGWGVRQLIKTNSMIETKYPKRRKDVYFGIDVFGRGQKAEFATNEVGFEVSRKFLNK